MFPAKILLVQLFSNGDCLYATAIARQIKHDYPDCHLSWIISSSCKHILTGNPFVDQIIETTDVAKDNTSSYRKFIKHIQNRKRQGEWDEVFITHLMDTNEANYDGCIRSAIFRGYGRPVTVDIMPVLRLTDKEIKNASDFSVKYKLKEFTHVVLFEFAPLSGQAAITPAESIKIAEILTDSHDTAVILSSARKIDHVNPRIIDGSVLSIRETAAITHYCHFLIGCSSGITWLTTSDGARHLPTLQLLNPFTNWINPLSRDFKRFGIDDSNLIELAEINVQTVAACATAAFSAFGEAKKKYHQPIPLHFKTTRKIVYNLLCYLEIGAILKHIRINREIFGNNPLFYKEVLIGFLISPFKLTANFFRKKIFPKFK